MIKNLRIIQRCVTSFIVKKTDFSRNNDFTLSLFIAETGLHNNTIISCLKRTLQYMYNVRADRSR